MSNDKINYLVQRMKRFLPNNILLIAIAMFSLAGCSDESGSKATVSAARPAPAVESTTATSPGKPSAPITIEYEILGKPIVGLPVAINITVRATRDLGPVVVSYSINDASALLFQDGQIERMEVRDFSELDMQQVTVIPQREGRLYINVSAEVQTPGGSMIKSMAIPIRVGSAPVLRQINGELKEGPDGETVISMPAQQN